MKAIDKQDQDELDKKLSDQEISDRSYEKQTKRHREYMAELIRWFELSPARSGKGKVKKYMVVISKDPNDIVNMSTGRSWTSCMSVDGAHHEDVYCEVAGGGFIAYLTDPKDKDIQQPKSRVLIRRFDPKDGEGKPVAMVEDSVYGWEIPGFRKKVQQWVDSKQGKIRPGFYSKKGGEHSDTFGSQELVTPEGMDDLWKWAEGDDENYASAAVSKLLELDKDKPLDAKSAKRLHSAIKKHGAPPQSYSTNGSVSTFLRNHPEFATDNDLKKMSTFDIQRMYQNMRPERQAMIRNQIADHLKANLKYPSPLQADMDKEDYPYKILELYRDLLNQAQVFNPIPDSIVQQMVKLADDLSSLPIAKSFGHEDTKKTPFRS